MLLRVPPEAAQSRLDRFIAETSGLTRSRVLRLIEGGGVLINGAVARASHKVRPGELVEVAEPHVEEPGGLPPEDIPLTVFYMDEDVAVVDKPPSMVVYPAAGHAKGTLMNALASRAKRLASVGGPLRPGVVHRLDKDTSGVMVVALSDPAYYNLVGQFRARTISRKYLALVAGSPRGERGEVDLMIGRSTTDRKKMSTRVRKGKEALTRWEAVERFGPLATLIEARLGTGRTHQIRVHMASQGHPVLGDRAYGRKTSVVAGQKMLAFPRQMLHAEALGFTHPRTGQWMEFRSPLPPDFEAALSALREAVR